MPWTLPPCSALASVRPDHRGAGQRVGDPGQQQPEEAHERHAGQGPLALEGLDEAVGGVHAHDHEHEDEEHHDRAGVDDDLDHPEEGRVLGDVEDRQVDHRQRDEQRAVHGLAGQHRAPCADHGQGGAHPEGDLLPGVLGHPHRPLGHERAQGRQRVHFSSVPAVVARRRGHGRLSRGHLRALGVRCPGHLAAVVVAVVGALDHGVRRGDHPGHERAEQVGLLVDQRRPAGVGQLVLVGHGQRARGAGLDAQPAQDAAQVVDLVDAPVALTGGEALLLGVRRTLDEDRVRGAGPRAQLAADALLQAVGVPVELVAAVEARLRGVLVLLLRVLLGVHLLEHGQEGGPEAPDGLGELRHWGPPVRRLDRGGERWRCRRRPPRWARSGALAA